jgi:CPA2 family monovalent cation:H+ antiporter-2
VTDESEDREEALQQRLHSVALTQGSGAIGKRLDKLNLPSVGVEVAAVRRRNVRTTTPAPDTVLEEGDIVVVLGTAEAVIAAEMKLMQG